MTTRAAIHRIGEQVEALPAAHRVAGGAAHAALAGGARRDPARHAWAHLVTSPAVVHVGL